MFFLVHIYIYIYCHNLLDTFLIFFVDTCLLQAVDLVEISLTGASCLNTPRSDPGLWHRQTLWSQC